MRRSPPALLAVAAAVVVAVPGGALGLAGCSNSPDSPAPAPSVATQGAIVAAQQATVARVTATPPPAATPATPAGTVRTVALDREFSLRPAETVTVAGTSLALTLVGVTNDSRCPTDVVCVWAGEATVVLAWRRGGDATEQLALTFAPGGDTGASLDRYRVAVVEVLPLPVSTAVIAPADYDVRLVVEAP